MSKRNDLPTIIIMSIDMILLIVLMTVYDTRLNRKLDALTTTANQLLTTQTTMVEGLRRCGERR